MAAGLGPMRLSPAHFWAMTPREFALAAGMRPGGGAPGRARLDELMRLYPDGGTGEREKAR